MEQPQTIELLFYKKNYYVLAPDMPSNEEEKENTYSIWNIRLGIDYVIGSSIIQRRL